MDPTRACSCGCVPPDMLSLFQMAELRAKKKKQEKELQALISKNLVPSLSHDGQFDLALYNMEIKTEQISCKNPYIIISENLVSLYLDNNLLDHFPPGVFPLLKNLRNLALHGNLLTYIPSDIGELQLMEECRLDNNKLESLPEEIGNCVSLVLLHIPGNITLTMLPSSLGNLSKLHHILMDGVSVAALPVTMHKCNALEFVSFDDTPLQFPPADVVSRGGDAIRAYLLQACSEQSIQTTT
jgi:internalin A